MSGGRKKRGGFGERISGKKNKIEKKTGGKGGLGYRFLCPIMSTMGNELSEKRVSNQCKLNLA